MTTFLNSLFSLMMLGFALQYSSIQATSIDVDTYLQEFQVPGIAIGVIKDGKIIHAQGYGFRNLEEQEPVTAETVFPIASCSKAFTAMLLAQLVEEGKVQWDDKVIEHLPDFTLLNHEHAAQITIRDLLAHRTGVPRHDLAWFPKDRTREELYQLLRYLEPQGALREQYLYSNIMYMVAGKVVEEKLGISWEEALQRRIFQPLAMKDTTASMAEFLSFSNRGEPYAKIDGMVQQVELLPVFAVNPASGINSSVQDMLKWVQAQLSGALVSSTQYEEMHTSQMDMSPTDPKREEQLTGVGFGWFIGAYQGEKLVRHGGMTAGFTSEVAMLPEKGIGLVLLANSSSEGLQALFALRNAILDELLGLPQSNYIERYKVASAIQPPEALTQALSFENYIGMYEHPAFGFVEIFAQDGDLFCCYGNATFRLQNLGSDTFVGKYMPLAVFAINPFVEFRFEKSTLAIGFESFHGLKPALFTQIKGQPAQ